MSFNPFNYFFKSKDKQQHHQQQHQFKYQNQNTQDITHGSDSYSNGWTSSSLDYNKSQTLSYTDFDQKAYNDDDSTSMNNSYQNRQQQEVNFNRYRWAEYQERSNNQNNSLSDNQNQSKTYPTTSKMYPTTTSSLLNSQKTTKQQNFFSTKNQSKSKKNNRNQDTHHHLQNEQQQQHIIQLLQSKKQPEKEQQSFNPFSKIQQFLTQYTTSQTHQQSQKKDQEQTQDTQQQNRNNSSSLKALNYQTLNQLLSLPLTRRQQLKSLPVVQVPKQPQYIFLESHPEYFLSILNYYYKYIKYGQLKHQLKSVKQDDDIRDKLLWGGLVAYTCMLGSKQSLTKYTIFRKLLNSKMHLVIPLGLISYSLYDSYRIKQAKLRIIQYKAFRYQHGKLIKKYFGETTQKERYQIIRQRQPDIRH